MATPHSGIVMEGTRPPTVAELSIACCVYPAAELLLTYCVAHLPPGASVLELGSGTGWFGLELAAKRPDLTRVCMTDMITQFISRAVDEAGRLGSPEVSVARVVWGEALPDLGSFDYVIGSDLVYSSDCARLLCATLRAILEAGQSVAVTDKGDGCDAAAGRSSSSIPFAGVPAVKGATRACQCLLAHHCERFMWNVDPELLIHLDENGLRALPLGPDPDSQYEYVPDTAPIRPYSVVFSIDLAGQPPASNLEAERVLRRALRYQEIAESLMSPEEKIEYAISQAFANSLDSADVWESGNFANVGAAIQAQARNDRIGT